MSHVIILEGPDGGGKTTLANHLRDTYGYQIRKTNQPRPGEDLFTSYTQALLDALNDWRPSVFDRHYLGECVYGPIMRGEDRLGEMGRTLIERLCAANGVPVVLVIPSWNQLKKNWEAKKGQDYLPTQDHLHLVHEEYFKQFYRLVDREFLGMYRYDMGDADESSVTRPCRRLPPGFSGYPEATVLVVGQITNWNAVPWDLPFHDLRGSSKYLYDQVKALGVPEKDLAWANAFGRCPGEITKRNLAACVGVMPNLRRVVALGKDAGICCRREFEQFEMGSPNLTVHEIPHPQFYKRFRSGKESEYQQFLKEAMGL